MTITREQYALYFGEEPRQDDLERANCEQAGKFGHYMCGVCECHRLPRFRCGCLAPGWCDPGIPVVKD